MCALNFVLLKIEFKSHFLARKKKIIIVQNMCGTGL